MNFEPNPQRHSQCKKNEQIIVDIQSALRTFPASVRNNLGIREYDHMSRIGADDELKFVGRRDGVIALWRQKLESGFASHRYIFGDRGYVSYAHQVQDVKNLPIDQEEVFFNGKDEIFADRDATDALRWLGGHIIRISQQDWSEPMDDFPSVIVEEI